jgi:hypothetical protein
VALVEHAMDALDLPRIIAARVDDDDLIIRRCISIVGVLVGVCSGRRSESESERYSEH